MVSKATLVATSQIKLRLKTSVIEVEYSVFQDFFKDALVMKKIPMTYNQRGHLVGGSNATWSKYPLPWPHHLPLPCKPATMEPAFSLPLLSQEMGHHPLPPPSTSGLARNRSSESNEWGSLHFPLIHEQHCPALSSHHAPRVAPLSCSPWPLAIGH